jgi:hypothetical protein
MIVIYSFKNSSISTAKPNTSVFLDGLNAASSHLGPCPNQRFETIRPVSASIKVTMLVPQ